MKSQDDQKDTLPVCSVIAWPQQEPSPETAEETFTVTRDQMEKMEQLAKMVSDASDKYLRLAAEYDNYRKRTAKEKESLYGDAKADTVKPFLEVLVSSTHSSTAKKKRRRKSARSLSTTSAAARSS